MQSTTQTRLSLSLQDAQTPDRMAGLYGSMKHKLYARIAAQRGKAKSHKTAFSREHGVTRAAEEPSVTHGTISHQVKSLEQWLGVSVFRRIGQSALLTYRCRLYPATISPALASIAIASRNLSQQEVLRVNTLPTFAMRWLFPRLVNFRAAHPTITVEISTGLEPVEELSGNIGEMHLPVCAPQLLETVPSPESRT
ncbi:MAG: LysR family transcriptional regulator [Paraburkholderia sp.]|jgi:LysR family glycine cleavage system transcriptional activator|uniref:LysR family transcriptional regulator n=1 Tax=Paraburkholderia sp. TaxID=1926495 RepID=UPI00397C92F0